MTGWKLSDMESHQTEDTRIRLANFSAGRLGNWRTVVQDEPGGDWDVTGPPHQTMKAAAATVSHVRAYYFGDEPTRAELIERIEHALAIIARDGSLAVLKPARMVEALQGPAAADVIREEDLDVSTVRPGGHAADVPCLTTGEFDAYVRITHKPTGITVERDAERSQLMNKAAALDEIRRQLAERTP